MNVLTLFTFIYGSLEHVALRTSQVAELNLS